AVKSSRSPSRIDCHDREDVQTRLRGRRRAAGRGDSAGATQRLDPVAPDSALGMRSPAEYRAEATLSSSQRAELWGALHGLFIILVLVPIVLRRVEVPIVLNLEVFGIKHVLVGISVISFRVIARHRGIHDVEKS